jgi:hypothetical protein
MQASCQLMGIVGPQIYQPKFGPTYRVSFATSIALLSCTIISVATSWYFVVKGDRLRAQQEGEARVQASDKVVNTTEAGSSRDKEEVPPKVSKIGSK